MPVTTAPVPVSDGGPVAHDPEAFRSAMRTLTAGVVMVTTRVDGRAWGLTISSCCSLSADPPQILVSLGTATVTCREALADGAFGVSLLSAGQVELAQLGAAPGAAKFVDEFCVPGEDDRPPRIDGGLFHLDCRVATALRLADHTVVVGEVQRIVPGPATERTDPLLYFDRAFRRLGDRPT